MGRAPGCCAGGTGFKTNCRTNLGHSRVRNSEYVGLFNESLWRQLGSLGLCHWAWAAVQWTFFFFWRQLGSMGMYSGYVFFNKPRWRQLESLGMRRMCFSSMNQTWSTGYVPLSNESGFDVNLGHRVFYHWGRAGFHNNHYIKRIINNYPRTIR